MCSCLWVFDRSGLCCCSVGAPAGLTLLVWRFPAAHYCVEASGGHRRLRCLGHAYKAELFSLIAPRQTYHLGILLSPRCQTLLSRCSLLNKNQVLILNITEQVNMRPQGQKGRICNSFLANLSADIRIYHPPARPMFRSVTFTWPRCDLSLL